MARPKKEETVKEKSTGSLLNRLKKASGSDTAFVLHDNELPINDWISTNNYMLNSLISGDPFKGIPSGRSVQLAGEKGTGKTMIAISIMNEAIKKGYSACLFDSEFANNDKDDMESKGVDTENVLWLGVNTVEDLKYQTISILDEISENEKVIMITDSIGNLDTIKAISDTKEQNNKSDMTRSKQLKSFFRQICMPLGYKNVPLVCINHTYADTSGSSFIPNQQIIAGGGGPAYGTSIILVTSKSQLKDGDDVVGAIIKIKSEKNRFAKEKSMIRMTIDFRKGGIQKYSGLLEFAVDEGILVPDSKIPKSGDISKIRKFIYKDEELLKKDITPEFWEKCLVDGLSDVLKNKFKYSSSTDGLVDDEDLMED
jgi:RecA/RadA recombinase